MIAHSLAGDNNYELHKARGRFALLQLPIENFFILRNDSQPDLSELQSLIFIAF